jgi:hypothetical protein
MCDMGITGGIICGIATGGGGIPTGSNRSRFGGGTAAAGPGAAGSGMSSGGSTPPNGFTGTPMDLSLLVKLKEKIGTRWRRAQPACPCLFSESL